ncbi:hypothetical protein JTE90_023261 [Oedothorax gibbosus]|uniref:Uncharacterized protein n=1 Tax=Oedothorax gibbosus TaxID=931172 RepID=A0AAV6TZJ9_9ARAC|nr:hypothetical protein JTE90_023261 [Oedothorax gibbosus]
MTSPTRAKIFVCRISNESRCAYTTQIYDLGNGGGGIEVTLMDDGILVEDNVEECHLQGDRRFGRCVELVKKR